MPTRLRGHGSARYIPDSQFYRLCAPLTHSRTVSLIGARLQTPSEGFYTDGCFVLVEGDYTDEETLSVIVIGHPPSERRKAAK